MPSKQTGCLLAIVWVIFIAAPTYPVHTPSDPRRPGVIAFERLTGSSLINGNVYLVHADGGGLTALTHDENSHHPAWSPDGKRILFIHSSVPANPRFDWEKKYGHPNEVYVMNGDGTNRHLLKRLESVIYAAAWSPDGTTLAISYQPLEWVNAAADSPRPTSGPIPAGLFLMDATGKGEPRLLFRDAWTPAWSPDGKKVAFSQRADKHFSVHVANSDGSHNVQLTNPNRDAGSPAWSPNGTQIAFSARIGYRNEQTFVMDSNGSHERQLTNDTAWNCREPSWSPDGKLIAVWCLSAGQACAGVISGLPGKFPPCRRIFVISTDDPKAKLQQVTDETGVYPQFAPAAK